jgi:hypothetical protein
VRYENVEVARSRYVGNDVVTLWKRRGNGRNGVIGHAEHDQRRPANSRELVVTEKLDVVSGTAQCKGEGRTGSTGAHECDVHNAPVRSGPSRVPFG